jgi:single-strand DNA-binding protein
MNRINLIGRITKDIELKQTKNEINYTRFSIAVKRDLKDESGEYVTDFFNVVAWRKTAEFISKYFKKGSRIAISGKLQQNIYTDKDGNERTSVEIVAEDIDFIDKKKDREEAPAEEGNPVIKDDEQVYADFGDSIEIDDDFDAF